VQLRKCTIDGCPVESNSLDLSVTVFPPQYTIWLSSTGLNAAMLKLRQS
jgi:hypothetical protein